MILGTVGYMSPEQARGERSIIVPTSSRSASSSTKCSPGASAFHGASAADTLSAILQGAAAGARSDRPGVHRRSSESSRAASRRIARIGFSPQPISASRSRQCQGSPHQPFTSIPPETAAMEVSRRRDGGLRSPLRSRRWPRRRWFAAKSAPQFQQLTFRRGTVQGARFAPDGQTIVYGAAWEGNPTELFSTRPEAPEARSLQLTTAGSSRCRRRVRWRWPSIRKALASSRARSRGRRSPAGPRQLAKNVVAADWAPNGAELAAVQSINGHSSLQYPIGKTLSRSVAGQHHPYPLLAIGRCDRVHSHPVSGDTAGSVMLTDLDGTTRCCRKGGTASSDWAGRRTDARSGSRARGSGAAQALYAVTRAGRERLLVGAPATLTLHDVSRDGRVLLTRDAWGAGVIAFRQAPPRARPVVARRVDGLGSVRRRKTMILEESWEAGGAARGIYLRTTDGAPAVRLGEGVPLALSPDKQWVIATSVAGDRLTLLPTGVGQTKNIASRRHDELLSNRALASRGPRDPVVGDRRGEAKPNLSPVGRRRRSKADHAGGCFRPHRRASRRQAVHHPRARSKARDLLAGRRRGQADRGADAETCRFWSAPTARCSTCTPAPACRRKSPRSISDPANARSFAGFFRRTVRHQQHPPDRDDARRPLGTRIPTSAPFRRCTSSRGFAEVEPSTNPGSSRHAPARAVHTK